MGLQVRVGVECFQRFHTHQRPYLHVFAALLHWDHNTESTIPFFSKHIPSSISPPSRRPPHHIDIYPFPSTSSPDLPFPFLFLPHPSFSALSYYAQRRSRCDITIVQSPNFFKGERREERGFSYTCMTRYSGR